MQLLGALFEYELGRRGETLNILGATSGDTGSAAEYAMPVMFEPAENEPTLSGRSALGSSQATAWRSASWGRRRWQPVRTF